MTEEAIGALFDLYTSLVEAQLRNSAFPEAERDLENAAVLEKFISNNELHGSYTSEFRALARGKVAALRAIVAMAKADFAEFDKWQQIAEEAVKELDPLTLERARVITMLARAKAESLLNMGKLNEADDLIVKGLMNARLLASYRFDEYSLFYRLAVTSKLKQDANEEAQVLIQDMLTNARLRKDSLAEANFQFQAGLAAFGVGSHREAITYFETGASLGKRYGIRFLEMMCTLWRMMLAGLEQDGEAVRESSMRLDAILSQSPNLFWRICLIEGRAATMNYMSRFQPAIESADEAIHLSDSNHYSSFAVWSRIEKATALIGLERFEEAEHIARESVELAGEEMRAERSARMLLMIALASRGKVEEAIVERDRIRGLYKNKNYHFLQFSLAELGLLRVSLARATSVTDKRKLKQQLEEVTAEAVQLGEKLHLPHLVDQATQEMRATALSTRSRLRPEVEQKRPTEKARSIRLISFGVLTIAEEKENGETELRTTSARDSKIQQLLALLIQARVDGSAISRDRLADSLWPEADQLRAVNSVHTAVKRARSVLGGVDLIEQSGGRYGLSELVRLDVEDILEHHERAKQAKRANAFFSVAHHLNRILELTSPGPFLEGVYGLSLEALRTRLQSIRRSSALQLIDLDLDRGVLDHIEEHAHMLLQEDEFDEEAIRALLILHGKRHRSKQVIEVYNAFATRLKTELESEPSPALKELYNNLRAA